MSMIRPGLIALLGSGETAAAGGQMLELLAARLGPPLDIAVLETPAGFEVNSAMVAGRVADYMKTRLQNYHPEVRLIAARKRETPFSPDNAEIIAPLSSSRLIFAGPGSPSYAVRQLRGSLAWDAAQARHRLGAALAFASAASIAVGRLALPVYEIYKVGQDPYWAPGLDLFGPYGLSLAIVPHWNNTDGGSDVDTSHCFIGNVRYEYLRSILPKNVSILGLDEHTSLIIDLVAGLCFVSGRDSVHIYCEDGECSYNQGVTFPISTLGPYHPLEAPSTGLNLTLWEQFHLEEQAHLARSQQEQVVPLDVQALAQDRSAARASRNWPEADRLRLEIERRGWAVKDTPENSLLEPLL
jgi:hypothetical protein